MIRRIKYRNFYSFNQEQEISFLTNKQKSYAFENSKAKDQISKINVFVGANASGKTNIMRLFCAISYFLSVPIRLENKPLPFKTFFNKKQPSTFEIEFELQGKIYLYDLVLHKDIVEEEQLQVINQPSLSEKKEKIFTRKTAQKTSFNEKYISGIPKEGLANILPNVSLVAYLKANYRLIGVINEVHGFFNSMSTNLVEDGAINPTSYQWQIVNHYYNDSKLKKRMENFIKNFDLGLVGFELNKEKDLNNTEHFQIFGLHDLGAQLRKIGLNYESRGTLSLFFILEKILTALQNNSVVIIDELELGLHPKALTQLISYFINENENGQAQLFFSSQSLNFLNDFKMQQIHFTQKNAKGESTVYRLDDIKDVRPDENFLAKYMAGKYGAVPEIKLQ